MAKTYIRNYFKPDLNGHKVLYKGRRFWAFEIDADRPFEIFDKSSGDLVVWDGFIGAALTEGKIGQDGIIRGAIDYGQGGVEVEGKDLAEFISEVKRVCSWIQREDDRAIRKDMAPFYNGRRIQILRGSNLEPARAGLHIYDKKIEALVGTASTPDGIAWEGAIVNGPFDEQVKGANLKEFVKDVIKTIDQALSE